MKPSSQIQYSDSSNAKSINNEERKSLTLDVIKGKQSITDASKENNVSRKFLHTLKNKALDAVDECFEESVNDKEIISSIRRNLEQLDEHVLSEWLFIERVKDRIGRRDDQS